MIILTIDTDWAPEWATAEIMDRLNRLGLKATVFFSTPPPVAPGPNIELGAHPDLSKDNHSILTEAEILDDYQANIVKSQCLRTHRFYWHSDLPKLLVQKGFSCDSSMILPYHPGLKPFKVGRLKRFPVWASDHLHLARGYDCGKINLPNWHTEGLKIFCFHVAYLYLNSKSLSEFNMINEDWPDKNALKADGRPGVWNLFERLADEIAKTSGGHWLSELPEEMYVSTQLNYNF